MPACPENDIRAVADVVFFVFSPYDKKLPKLSPGQL